MKTTFHVVLSLFCLCSLCLLASAAPALAEGQAAVAEAQAPNAGQAPDLFPVAPLVQACTLQIECADGSVISCNGNSSCSTSGGGRCTTCDGVQTACCPKTCCEVCEENYIECSYGCDPSIPITCRICDRVYDKCVGQCTGGCF